MTDQTTTATDALREAVARRVRALMAKTVENGATEAEAIAAAAKARSLLDAYRLTQSDLEVEAEPIEDTLLDRPNAQRLAAVDLTLTGIDRYCGVKTWFNRQRGVRRIRMIGLKSDVEMAVYLYRLIAEAIKRETVAYAGRPGGRDGGASVTRTLNQSFQVGMAHRINARLKDMAKALEPTARTATGTALVVVKSAAVNAAFDKLGIKLSGGLSGPRARSALALMQ